MGVRFFFFFNDTATTEIYTLSLHDALPISDGFSTRYSALLSRGAPRTRPGARRDRKSTRLNSSHLGISYAVFCLKKKKAPRRQATLLLTFDNRIRPPARHDDRVAPCRQPHP